MSLLQSAITNEVESGSELIGSVLGDRYRVVGHLGSGAMAEVYEAHDQSTGRTVAVKLIGAEIQDRVGYRERFEREVFVASKIDHPGCIKILDFGTGPDERPYLVMELVGGQALADVLDEQERLEVDRALEITRQIVAALVACHDAGVLHRDVKPENIVLSEAGDSIKLLDFGIAKLLGDAAVGHAQLTQVGLILGTPHYIAPEWLSRDDVDGRADLYSVTIVLYEMLTSTPPFVQEDRRELMKSHLRDTPAPLSERVPNGHFSAELEAFVQKGLAKEPEQRFADARSYLRALAELQGVEPPTVAMQARAALEAKAPLSLARPKPQPKSTRRLAPGAVIREHGDSHSLSDGLQTTLGAAPAPNLDRTPSPIRLPQALTPSPLPQPYNPGSAYEPTSEAVPRPLPNHGSQPVMQPMTRDDSRPFRARTQPVTASRRLVFGVLGGGILLLVIIALAVNAGSDSQPANADSGLPSLAAGMDAGTVPIEEEPVPPPPSQFEASMARWKDAGMAVMDFPRLDGENPAECTEGKVSGLRVMICAREHTPETDKTWNAPVTARDLSLRVEAGRGKRIRRLRRKIVRLFKKAAG